MELDIVKKDSWLAPFSEIIEGRHNRVLDKISHSLIHPPTLSSIQASIPSTIIYSILI